MFALLVQSFFARSGKVLSLVLIRGGRRRGRFRLVRGIYNATVGSEEARGRRWRIGCHCCCPQVRNGGLAEEGQILPAHVYQGIEGFLGGVLWVELGHFGGETVNCYHLSHGCHVGLLDSRGYSGDGGSN